MTAVAASGVQWYDVKEGVDVDDLLYDFCDKLASSPSTYDYSVVYSDDHKQFCFKPVTTEQEITTKLMERRAFITRDPTLGAMLVLLCGEPDPEFVRGPGNIISDRSGTEVDALVNGGAFYFTARKNTEETIWHVWLGKVGERKSYSMHKTKGHRPVKK
jgi:hypothetical protein